MKTNHSHNLGVALLFFSVKKKHLYKLCNTVVMSFVTACDNGRYGLGCVKLCPDRCFGVCKKDNGHCPLCVPGYMGDFCDKGWLIL